MGAFCLRRVENALDIFQLDRITSMHFLSAIQFEFPLRGCDGDEAVAAKRIDRSVRVFTVDKG